MLQAEHWISIVGLGIVTLGSVLGFFLSLLARINKIKEDCGKEADSIREDFHDDIEKKVRRVHERMNEDQERLEQKFVSKDVCSIKEAHNKDSLDRLEALIKDVQTDVKTILKSKGV